MWIHLCVAVCIYTSVVQTAHSAPVKREAGGTEMLWGWPAVTHNCDLFIYFFLAKNSHSHLVIFLVFALNLSCALLAY